VGGEDTSGQDHADPAGRGLGSGASVPRERARSGEGPSLVDLLSYRWRGHSKSDRNLYRTSQEIDEWKHKCPIKRFKKVLVEAAVMTTDEVESLDQAAKLAVDRAAEVALTFPEPSPENMEDEVYAP